MSRLLEDPEVLKFSQDFLCPDWLKALDERAMVEVGGSAILPLHRLQGLIEARPCWQRDGRRRRYRRRRRTNRHRSQIPKRRHRSGRRTMLRSARRRLQPRCPRHNAPRGEETEKTRLPAQTIQALRCRCEGACPSLRFRRLATSVQVQSNPSIVIIGHESEWLSPALAVRCTASLMSTAS